MVIPGHNLGNSQVSVNRTIGPTLVCSLSLCVSEGLSCQINLEIVSTCFLLNQTALPKHVQ